MRDNKGIIIRSFQLTEYTKDNSIMCIDSYIDDTTDNELITDSINKKRIVDSELTRIIATIDADNIEITDSGDIYLPALISISIDSKNLGNNGKWKHISESDGKLKITHCNYRKSTNKLESIDEEATESFKRLLVSSSHARNKKAFFVRENIWEKVNEILMCGLNKTEVWTDYPNYKKGGAKWNCYYGLAATDSKAVKDIPRIVVIPDFEREVEDYFEHVQIDIKDNDKWKEGDSVSKKYEYTYKNIHSHDKEKVSILPFDGAGLVSVECAQKWADELDIKSKKGSRYIPASFQFRAIPGIKGNVYTFDINKFGENHGYIISDITGKKHDIREEQIDLILTESQTKFLSIYNNDIDVWYSCFKAAVVLDESGNVYQRTFNISEYAESQEDVSHDSRSAYQHLQTVTFSNKDIKSYVRRTIDKIKKISSSFDDFLRFYGCDIKKLDDKNYRERWDRIPAYYKAAAYMKKTERAVMYADEFIRKKVSEDIERISNDAKIGRLDITGNYQVLTPDIYGLAQYAFMSDKDRNDEEKQKSIGYLKANNVWSNWWNTYYKDTKKIALIRNPHIYMEARVCNLHKSEFEWYKYQTTGIITDSFSTVPLSLGTADFDGDHIQTTNSDEYIRAVEKAIKMGWGRTVKNNDLKKNDLTIDITNISDLMECDRRSYLNNIGQVINKVTELWGAKEQNDKVIRNYIAISDIIGQLTIDSTKTGEYIPYDENISEYIRNKKIGTPYFRKYDVKFLNEYKKEKTAKKNAEQLGISTDQARFYDSKSNMNRICHVIEKELDDVKLVGCDNKYDVSVFVNLFRATDVSTDSKLYKRIKVELKKLIREHEKVTEIQETEEDKKVGIYDYYYMYARYSLLNQCKLSKEKSIDKVLNCLIWLCYMDKDITEMYAKCILWNSFGEEMICRAKKSELKEFGFDNIDDKLSRVTKSYKKCIPVEKEISELINGPVKKAPIIITEHDRKWMNDKIKSINKTNDRSKKELKKLLLALMIINKSLHEIRLSKNGNEYLYQNYITIVKSSNTQLTYSALANMIGFNESQRKRIADMLRTLNENGCIKILDSDLSQIRVKVLYDKECNGTNLVESKYVERMDYKGAFNYLKRRYKM